jgi:hypothetical protein
MPVDAEAATGIWPPAVRSPYSSSWIHPPGQESLASWTSASYAAGTAAAFSGPGGTSWSPCLIRASPSSPMAKTYGWIAWQRPEPMQ